MRIEMVRVATHVEYNGRQKIDFLGLWKEETELGESSVSVILICNSENAGINSLQLVWLIAIKIVCICKCYLTFILNSVVKITEFCLF